ncbi:hypothetical protein ACROYT_G044640 [Oculina patagonica]
MHHERVFTVIAALLAFCPCIDSYACCGQCGPTSCKEIYDQYKPNENKAYMLQMDSGKLPIYCNMNGAGLGDCGGGGWTLVMKTDGAKKTFHYDSPYWTNKKEYGIPEGETGLDNEETKLPTYWNTPFTKICLGMKFPGKGTDFIVIDKKASSLYALIADGKYRPTSLGRDMWKALIGSAANLQPNCNREGFNAVSDKADIYSRARIGIASNNENECVSCDSRIGFGTGGHPDDSVTCGNVAQPTHSHPGTFVKAMGYILVK